MLLAFAVYMAIGILAASLVAVLVVRHNVKVNSLQKVNEHTAFVASAVAPNLIEPGEWERPLSGDRLDQVDDAVRRDLIDHSTLRAKIYNADGTIIYSTEPADIGREHESELTAILEGGTRTEVEELNHHEGAGGAKVIESYAPITYPGSDQAVGVFEIYTDYAAAAGSLRKQALPLTGALLLVLLALYLAMLPLLRRTMRALDFSNRELRRQANDLNSNLAKRAEIEDRLRTTIKELERSEDQLALSQEETIMRLSIAVESRDAETGSHIERMGRYCALLAEKLDWSEGACELLRVASPLHDVGKIAIPDAVLQKPGALTPDERKQMEEHAAIGHRILAGSDSPLLDLAARIALTHHEKWDGSGYPNGLKGEDIPIEGRLAAVADVFDALTSDRVYRPAMPLEKALAILQEGRGTHFDPEILDHFFNSIDEVIAIRNNSVAAPEQIRDGSPKRRHKRHGKGAQASAGSRVASAGDAQQSLVG
ncbi:MAG: HD domain-containing protein [Actinobacteria bacterium]|nr:HD domain-containing protein [Actinomycetota bacterium]